MIFNPIIFGSEEASKLNPSAVPAAAQSLFADVIKVAIDDTATEGNTVSTGNTGKPANGKKSESTNETGAEGAVALLFAQSGLISSSLPEAGEETVNAGELTGSSLPFVSETGTSKSLSTPVYTNISDAASSGKIDLSLFSDIEQTKIDTENLLKDLKLTPAQSIFSELLPSTDEYIFPVLEQKPAEVKPLNILSAPTFSKDLKNQIMQNAFPRGTSDFLDDIIKDIKTFRLNSNVTVKNMPSVSGESTVTLKPVLQETPAVTGADELSAPVNAEQKSTQTTGKPAVFSFENGTAGPQAFETAQGEQAAANTNEQQVKAQGKENKNGTVAQEAKVAAEIKPVQETTSAQSKTSVQEVKKTDAQNYSGTTENNQSGEQTVAEGKPETAAVREGKPEAANTFESAVTNELKAETKETVGVKVTAQELTKEISKEQTVAKTKMLTPAEVVKELQTASVKKETGTLQMQLTPENLGKVDIKITMSGGLIKAAMNVENEQAKQALEQSLKQFQQSTPELSQTQLTVHISVAQDQQQRQKPLPQKKRMVKQEEFTTEDVNTETARKLGYNTYEYVA